MEEYLIRIRQGDEDAFASLLKDYRKMIYSIINSFNREHGDYAISEDDLFQEASLALLKAARTYEEDKEMKFSSFAYMVIKKRIINVIKQHRRTYEEEHYSIDNYEFFDHMTCFAVCDQPYIYHRECELREHLSVFYDSLSAEDRKIVDMRQDSLSYRQIAAQLHSDVKRIDNRLMAVKRELRSYMKKYDLIRS